MNVVDSSAWLSYFAGDKNSGYFAKPIEAIAHIEQGKVISLDSELAVDAVCYGFEYKLPLADSIIYVTAPVWRQL